MSDVRVSPRREYLYGSLASHILGYVKQWEKGEISPEEKRKFKHYTGESKGIAGVEATMNDYLTGEEGIKTLLKNEKGQVLQMVDYIKPDVGSACELTIDLACQCLVENTLRRVGRAAAVVMDPNTGEILAMASVPDFTPSYFVPSIDPDAWKNYNTNQATHWSTRPSTTSPQVLLSNFPLLLPLPFMDMPTIRSIARLHYLRKDQNPLLETLRARPARPAGIHSEIMQLLLHADRQ